MDVDWDDPTVPALVPCIVCGQTPTHLDAARMAPKMSGPGSVVSATIRHWCGDPGRYMGGLAMSLTNRDAKTAADSWNAWHVKGDE